MGCAGSATAAPGKPGLAIVATVDAILIEDLALDTTRGASVSGSESVVKEPAPQKFKTLLEAFRYADPTGSGKICDDKRFSEVSGILTSGVADTEVGIKPVTFPSFVDWARSQDVTLPLGMRGCESGVFPFPPTWKGPKNDSSWNKRLIVQDDAHRAELQELLNVSYKNTWTRDRKTTGINQVPSGFKLERALLNENIKEWRAYYAKRETILENCKTKPGFLPIEALTSGSKSLHGRHQMNQSNGCNEWLLFHGTTQEAAKNICASYFNTDFAGTATGTLYGDGIYFTESITKADEYAKQDANGLCCALVCRVVGGRVLYNTEKTPDASHVKQCVQSGAADSILGDRESTRKTFREFVTFSTDQVYIEYVLFYRRVYEDIPLPAMPTSGKPVDLSGFDVVYPAKYISKASPSTATAATPKEVPSLQERTSSRARQEVPSLQERVNYFNRNELLKDLRADEKYELAKALIERNFNKDENLFEEGVASDAFFIVYDGEISLHQNVSGFMWNFYCTIPKASIHGELALVEVKQRSYTLKAVTDVRTLSLDKTSFEKLLGPMAESKTREECTCNHCHHCHLRALAEVQIPLSARMPFA
jgi:hypothetical protein